MRLGLTPYLVCLASGRTGPLKALIDRTATLGSLEAAAVQVITQRQ